MVFILKHYDVSEVIKLKIISLTILIRSEFIHVHDICIELISVEQRYKPIDYVFRPFFVSLVKVRH